MKKLVNFFFFTIIFIVSVNLCADICGNSEDFVPVLDSGVSSSIYNPTGITLNANSESLYDDIYILFNDEEIKVTKECSGVLIDRDLFLTAGHCVQGYFEEYNFNESRKPTYVGFNYYEESGEEYNGLSFESEVVAFEINVESIEWSVNDAEFEDADGQDYAVFRLNPNGEVYPGDLFGTVEIKTGKFDKGDSVYLIGHPDQRTSQYSSGQILRQDNYRLFYNADTLEGSSGSPVFLNGHVIAINIAGECESPINTKYTIPDVNPANIGTSITAICRLSSTVRALFSPEQKNDADDDGIWDCEDVCPFMPPLNGGQHSLVDSDGDGIVDECDNCPLNSNKSQTDKDFDGVGDECDNCVNTPNFYQGDEDGDGYGNECDRCPHKWGDYQDSQDSDGDGIPDTCDNCPNIPNYFKELYNPYSEIVIGASNLNNGYWKQMGNLEWVYMWQPDHDLDGSGDACDEKSGYNKGYTTSKTWVSQPKISIGNKEVAAEIFAVEANRTLSINVWGGFYNPIDTLCFPSPGGYGEVCLPLGGQHRVHYCGLDLAEYCVGSLWEDNECTNPGNRWDGLCQTEVINVNNESVNIGRSHATIDTPSFDLGPRWPKISWDYDSKKAAMIKYSEVNNHRDSIFASLKQPSAHWNWRADISAQYNCATYYSDYAICDNESIGAVKKNTPLYYDLSSNYATTDGNYLVEDEITGDLVVNFDYFKNKETRNIEFGGPSLSNYKYSLATRLNSQPSIVQYRKNYISPSELMDSYKYYIENSAFESSASNILIPPVDLIFQEISFVRYQNGSFENNFSGYYPLISSYIPALNSTTQIIEGNRPGVTYSISQTSDNGYDLHVNYAPSSDWRKIGTVLNYGDFDVSDFAAATIYNDTIYMVAEDNNLAASLKYLYRIVRSSGNFVVQQISLLPVSGSSRARLISSMNNLYLVSDNNGIFSTWKVNPENGVSEEITLGLSPVFKTPLNIMGTENGIYLAGKYDPVNPDNTIIAKLSDNNGWQIIHSNVNAETGKLIMNVIDGKLVMTDILSDDPVTTRTVLDMTDDSVIIEEIETPDIYGIEEDPSEYCLNETDDFLKGGLLVNDECTPFTHPWYRSFATGSTIYSIAGKGDRLYVGTNSSIKVYDISDPEAFVLKYTFSTDKRVYDLEVAEDDIMYAATSGGIYKLDTANPDTLSSLSFFATSYNYQYRIQLYNDKLYVGDDNGINIRDKETFARLAYVNIDSVLDFAIANGEIALYRSSFWSAGLHIRDVETLNLKAYEYAECYTGELTTDHGAFYLSCDGYEYRFEGRPDTYFNFYPLDGDIREMQENHVYNGWTYIPDGSSVKLSTLNDVPSYCGNGVIEPGELCDGNSIQCTTLDPDYTGGTAACNSTCDGYNESYCEEDGW